MAEEAIPADPKHLVIQANKGINAVLGVGAAFFLLGGLAMFREMPVTAFFEFALAAMMLFAFFFYLLKGSLYLELTSDRLSYRTRKSEIFSASWRDIKEFRPGWMGYEIMQTKGNRHLFIDYQRNGRLKTFPILPRLFGMNPDDMLKLMMQYYRAAAAPEGTPVAPAVEQ